jgi:hypothetical protein
VCRAKHRHRIRLEKAIASGQELPGEEEVEERGQLDWTWDPEQCGESMQVCSYIVKNVSFSRNIA